VPSDSNPARRASETRSFGTTKREVLVLADWLRSWQGARGGDGGSQRLLEGLVLPAGGRGVRVRAYERQAGVRRQIARHVGKLGALGFEVTLCRIPEPDPDPTGQTQAA